MGTHHCPKPSDLSPKLNFAQSPAFHDPGNSTVTLKQRSSSRSMEAGRKAPLVF